MHRGLPLLVGLESGMLVLSGDEEACRGKSCSGWRMAGGVIPAVIRGDGGWLCHDDDVSAYRDRRGSMGVQEFLRVVVVLLGR
jgi:hypothetical protein